MIHKGWVVKHFTVIVQANKLNYVYQTQRVWMQTVQPNACLSQLQVRLKGTPDSKQCRKLETFIVDYFFLKRPWLPTPPFIKNAMAGRVASMYQVWNYAMQQLKFRLAIPWLASVYFIQIRQTDTNKQHLNHFHTLTCPFLLAFILPDNAAVISFSTGDTRGLARSSAVRHFTGNVLLGFCK